MILPKVLGAELPKALVGALFPKPGSVVVVADEPNAGVVPPKLVTPDIAPRPVVVEEEPNAGVVPVVKAPKPVLVDG